MKQREYIEGSQALENFEQFATAILRSPKSKTKGKKQPNLDTSRKPKSSDKD